ncbi:unnamed protein product [Lota lota]
MAEEAVRSNTSTSPAEPRSFGTDARQSPPVGSGVTHALHLLDTAAQQFIVHRDFHTSFGLCEKGLAILVDNEKEHSRWGEVKEGLCILGVQALAELDQWPEVLSWVLRQYELPEEIPAQIMQMCILLYAKVGQEAVIQEAAWIWLLCPVVAGQGCYRTVAELYLLCVLLPLGRTDDARRLVLGEVGGRAFSEDQRQLALDVVMEKETQGQETPAGCSRSPSPGVPVPAPPPGGQNYRCALMDKLRAMLRLLCRSLSLSSSPGWFPLRRLFMAMVILYILVVRMNPGLRGLGNYGLTCCVNALLQSFSATVELKDLLDRWDSSSVHEADLNVPLQLKRALGAFRDPSCLDPHRHFLYCLDRQHIRLNVQHDADEVFLAVLNFIQQQMDDKALAREIQSLYQISVEHHLQCLQCSSTQTQPGPSYLLSLPLHIGESAHNTLKDCMESFFKLQELSGYDSCLCAQCRAWTPSKQGLKILSLPTILCVQLQRFRYQTHGIRKLDCSVEFPESFDFQEICSQDVFSKDFKKNERTEYSLFAVIVHTGTAMCGHYTAYVRSRPGQGWFYADDSRVEGASWDEVKNTYGGHRSRTAYMLLYRRNSDQEGEEAQKPEHQLSG